MPEAAAHTYVLLFRDESGQLADAPPEDIQAVVQQFVVWTGDLAQQGKLAGVSRLSPEPPRILRRRDGAMAVDGPYAESKEIINGFVTITVADEAEALAICETCPMLTIGGSIELRRADDFPTPP